MKETGIVQKIENNIIFLNCVSAEGCSGCAAHSICKVEDRPFPAENRSGENLNPGDKVEYELPQAKTIKASFMLLIFPLILFIIFFIGAGVIFPALGEMSKILIAFIGLALGFGGALLYGKANKIYPSILRKL